MVAERDHHRTDMMFFCLVGCTVEVSVENQSRMTRARSGFRV